MSAASQLAGMMAFPVYIPRSSSGSGSHASPAVGFFIMGAALAMSGGACLIGLKRTHHRSFDDSEVRRVARIRAARRAHASDAGEGASFRRVRVIEPRGGRVPAWLSGEPVAWARLEIESDAGELMGRCSAEERGEILVEDEAGHVIVVAPEHLDRTAPDPRVYGRLDELPPPEAAAVRERSLATRTGYGREVRFCVSTAQLVPGDRLWLVGLIRRVEGDAAGTPGYRTREGHPPFVSDGDDRILVPAATDEEAEAVLACAAAPYRQARFELQAYTLLVAVGVAAMGYSLTQPW